MVLHDADLEYAPASLTVLVETIESGIADAVHSPVVAGAALAQGTVRRCAKWLLISVANRPAGLRLSNMETSRRAFRHRLIQALWLVQDRSAIKP